MKRLKRIIETAFVLGLGSFIFIGCNSGDYNSKEVSTPIVDSSAVKKDSLPMMSDTTSHPMMSDTTSHPMMSDSTTISKNTDAVKKSAGVIKKKAKVTIVLPTIKNTGAMNMDKEGYYSNVEVLPAFPGGQRALEKFFEDNIVYPDPASQNGTEGVVTLSFVVDEKGHVFNPVVVNKKLGDGIEEEAIRVFNKMPTWTAGKIKGNNVKTRYSLPIRFQLN